MPEVRLAVSNICWPDGQAAHREAIDTLLKLDVPAIDIAPTKVWPHMLSRGVDAVTEEDIADFKRTLRGREISGFQSLTYGVPPNPWKNTVFANPDTWVYGLYEHVGHMVNLAQRVGATTLVYGAPATRRRDGVNDKNHEQLLAENFFSPLVEQAEEKEVILGIEPVSTDYVDNPFGRSAHDLLQTAVGMRFHGQRVFSLVPDTYAMSDAGDDVPRAIHVWGEILHSLAPHWQISEKGMAPVGAGTMINHRVFADALQAVIESEEAAYQLSGKNAKAYDGPITLAIEMRPDPTVSVTHALTRAVNFVREHYPQVA